MVFENKRIELYCLKPGFVNTSVQHSTKHFLTTKITKVTKDLDRICGSKLGVPFAVSRGILRVLRGYIYGAVPNLSSARVTILDPPSSILGLCSGFGFAAVVLRVLQVHFGAPASKRARRVPLPSTSSRWFPKIFHDLTCSSAVTKSRSVSIPSGHAMNVMAIFPNVSRLAFC